MGFPLNLQTRARCPIKTSTNPCGLAGDSMTVRHAKPRLALSNGCAHLVYKKKGNKKMKTRSLFYRKHIEGAMTAPIVDTRISEDVMAKFDRIMGD